MSHLPSPRRPLGHRLAAAVAAIAVLGHSSLPGIEPIEPPPVIFEGLGLEGFTGTGSVSAALRRTGAIRRSTADDALPVDVNVRGPSGANAAASPLAAEVRSRIERFDIAAGLRADPTVIQEGPASWTGRICMKNERDEGSEVLELRTTIGRWHDNGSLGLELGPRIERQIGRRTTFFIDGKAEARAVRTEDTGWWALPGTSAADGAGMVGVTARTGIVR